MDCAPLNLAHFHERRADKLIQRHDYDEAYKAVETSLLYVQDAYKNVRIPKALEVLNTQMWDYERKLQQIQMRKQQFERMKVKEIVPLATHSNETNIANVKTVEMLNAQSIARSIDKTIKDFNDKYGSTSLMVNVEDLAVQQSKENQDPKQTMELSASKDETKETRDDVGKRRLSILDEHLQTDEELPSLVPLELPSFDYCSFMSSGLVENFQK